MNRAQWEAEAMARRMGARSLPELLERRARDRRNANLARDWENERRRQARRESDLN